MVLSKRYRPYIEPLEDRNLLSANVVVDWNELLLQSLPSQPPRVPLARNLALVHVAMFDAANAISKSYEPYYAQVHASSGASQEAAVAQAAHDTLVALYPGRKDIFDAALADDLASIPPGRARQGVAIGSEVARQVLALRANDGSSAIKSYNPPNQDPGQWQPTAPDFSPAAAVHVPDITPFAVTSSSQFLPGPPPALDSQAYTIAFNEAKELGSLNSTTRTADQTQVAMLWRVPLTNHQVWNRIAQDLAQAQQTSLEDSARLFALMDMALNDGLETSFGAKFHYTLWRPITAIQRAAEDGNDNTVADPNWMTLHPNTPAYPTYSGNAATIGATCATVLAGVFGTNDISFEISWARYGFPGVTRSYTGFWAAAEEEANSRIYGGIHFRFDSVAGQNIGANVAHYVMDNFLEPLDEEEDELRAAEAALTPREDTLRADQVRPLFTEALVRWQAAGINPSALSGVDIRIADLGGLTLGKADGGVLWLDDNAAGWGWFVDATPGNDSEFTMAGDQGELGRMDLLTVLGHEVGHLLGYEHSTSGLMQDTLTAGTRRSMSPDELSAMNLDAFRLLAADENAGGTRIGLPGRMTILK